MASPKKRQEPKPEVSKGPSRWRSVLSDVAAVVGVLVALPVLGWMGWMGLEIYGLNRQAGEVEVTVKATREDVARIDADVRAANQTLQQIHEDVAILRDRTRSRIEQSPGERRPDGTDPQSR